MKTLMYKLSFLSISLFFFANFAKATKPLIGHNDTRSIPIKQDNVDDSTLKFIGPPSPDLLAEAAMMPPCNRVNQLAPAASFLDSGINGLCFGCSVSDEANLLDADLTNFATIDVSLGVAGSGFITLQLPQTYPAGTRGGFLIDDGGGALSLFNGATLTSSLGGVVQQVLSGGSLLNVLGLGGPQTQRIETIFCEEFDELKIELGGFAGGAANYKVYYGYVDEGCQFPVQCGGTAEPEICGDGIDNDGDGLLDFEDDECQNGPGGVFDNLLHWAKADYNVFSDNGTTTAVNGGTVEQWNDAAPGQFHLSATAGLEPTFLDGTAATNFNPSLDFNVNNMTNSALVLPQGSDVTIFAVGTTDVTAGLHSIYAFGDNANDPSMNLNGTAISPRTDGSVPNSVDLFSGQVPIEKPMIWGLRGENEATTADDLTFMYQGEEVGTGGMDVPNTPQFMNGVDVGGATNSWDGHIMEVITYNRKLTIAEVQMINTYLAIKYGITLRTVDNDGSIVEGNYVHSDGTVIWDATINAAYHNNVAGIGGDTFNALEQKQSIGLEDDSTTGGCDALVTIALGSTIAANNAANATTFAVDESYLLWGNNDLDTIYTTAYVPQSFTPADDFLRMPRTWKTQETGTIGNVTVGIPEDRKAEYLLVSPTDNFIPATTTEIQLTNDGNGNLTAVVDLANGQFFTFGKTIEDADMDGFGVHGGDTDDMDPCVPDNAASPCCEAESPVVTKD